MTDRRSGENGMMMSASCGLACMALALIGVVAVLAAFFTRFGDSSRRLRAELTVARLRRRGMRVVDAAFYGNPGEGWFAVTVNADDPSHAPRSFQVPDSQATVKAVMAEWNRVRSTN